MDDITLKKFKLFSEFTQNQLEYIKANSKLIKVPPQKILLAFNSINEHVFFLLKGELKLIATDGKEELISASSASATNPIARIRPCQYQVSTHTEVALYVSTEIILQKAHDLAQDKEFIVEDPAIQVDYMAAHNNKDKQILFDILSLLHTDQLILPSLPDIALKIRHAVENEDSDASQICKIINMDQSIVTKILKTANSAMYNVSGNKIISTKDAFLRIGTKSLVHLVLSYSMKEVFSTNSVFLKKKMKQVWQHSVSVAAISCILTRLTSTLDPEKALLAGLLHNIGAVAIINNLEDYPTIIDNEEKLDMAIYELQSEVGESILSKWEFPEELISVAKHSTNWLNEDNDECEYSHIINIAQLHAYIGTTHQFALPKIDEIPAFNILSLGQLTPELSMQIIKKSEEEINQTIALFD